MEFVGIDGCRYGWVVVSIAATSEIDISIFRTEELLQICDRFSKAKFLLIDMPIGLVSNSIKPLRLCDGKARSILGFPRSASVFSPPCRQAVYTDSYEIAKQINLDVTGKSISIQAWNIKSKIKIVDEFLQNYCDYRHKLREYHPELCFFGLNQQSLQYSKHTSNGYQERLAICDRFLPKSRNFVESSSRKFEKSRVKPDDILDALVGAIAAFKANYNLNFLQNLSQIDSTGLTMDIVFCG